MFPSIDIVNTTQETLEFQKGARLIRLTPGLNTLGTHEWPFAQRAFGARVRLAKDIPAKTFIDGPNAPVREPEPEPVDDPAASFPSGTVPLVDETQPFDAAAFDAALTAGVVPVEPEPVDEFNVPASKPDPEPVAHSLFTEPETLNAVPELPVTEPVVPEAETVPEPAPLNEDKDKGV